MKKLYESIIFIGFISFFIGGVIIVLGQTVGIIINNPNFVLFFESITKYIFPIAAISGLLCFMHPYIFKKFNESKIL